MKALIVLILAFPLLGSVFHILLGRYVSRRAVELTACGSILIPLMASLFALKDGLQEKFVFTLFHWFSAGGLTASFDVYLNPLASVMTVMVTFVSLFIHVYSIYYMRGDEGYVRYFCFLNLFVFFMLVITLADNLVFLFLGWEGVGFCSYALIGFWFTEQERIRAGNKAFILTRIGDVAFLVSIALFLVHFNSLSVTYITANTQMISAGTAALLGFLLLWAAVGKSAQLPLLVWLPDAMYGPTPVSALIHAATMVTAGVYLLMRLFPIMALSQSVLFAVSLLAVLTALFASLAALSQREIKRVLAWSTISQVGFMFLGLGVSNVAGSMFHLLTHAFFKALLFMGAGCIIKALEEEHDIYRMGSQVRKALPHVFWLFIPGALALGGIPPFSGFFSKGEILLSALHHPGSGFKLVWILAVAASFLTSVYTFRLVFLAFFGEPAEKAPHIKKIAPPMSGILWPLAVLAVTAGILNFPGDYRISGWLSDILFSVAGGAHHAGKAELFQLSLDILIAVAGLLIAFVLFGPGDRIGRRYPVMSGKGVQGIFLEGLGLDRLYNFALVRPYRLGADFLWRRVDERIVDGAAEGTGKVIARASTGIRYWTTGRLSTYLNMLLAGLFFIFLILLAAKIF